MSAFVFETAPKIVCEQGAALKLGEIARGMGLQQVFLVTDDGLVKAGVTDGAVSALRQAGVAVHVFSEVLSDPPEASVESAVARARSVQADGVIGLGGGSSLDTAKLVALLACTPQHLTEVYGVGLARGPRLPLIQIPTTAGTGSEVTPISIVTTPSHEKKGVVSPLLYPDVAVLDSLLTLGLPPAITAMTGVDAMVHAIEAFTSRHKKNPVSDTLALQALQLLYQHIRTAVNDGRNSDARERMLQGSLMAGMAFANAPVAAVHALAYPLGGHYHLPHGLSNSLVLAAVLRFNLPTAQSAYAQLGRTILPELHQSDDSTAAKGFVKAMSDLVAAMPYPQSLREAGIRQEDLPMLARDAMNVQRLLVNNPRDVTLEDALAIYQASF